MAVAGDWEMEFAGLALGAGSSFDLVSVSGLLDLPELRSSDLLLLRRHGAYAGEDFLAPRTITLELSIFADTDADMELRMAEFLAAFAVGAESPLQFQLPGVAGGVAARVWARTKRRNVVMDLEYVYGVAKASVQLVATDPRIYVEVEDTGSTGMREINTGHTFNVEFPLVFAGEPADGVVELVNAGGFDAPVLFRIDGPVSNPSITNETTGQTISFTTSVADGEYLLVDTAARSVLLNGTASRYNTIDAASVWFDLAPGTNSILFTGQVFDPDALLTATWRSASV